MARTRQRSTAPENGKDARGGSAGDLGELRRLLRAADASTPDAPPVQPGKRIRLTVAPAQKAEDRADLAATPDADELALFRRTVGSTRPIRRDNRAELDPPRPAPVRRTLQAEDEAPVPARPRADQDPLLAAYAGVVPLRDSGRAEIDAPPRQARNPGTETATAVQRPDAIVLPADADLRDPASLFRTVVGHARPIDTRNRVELQRPAPPPAPVKREADERAALDESLAAPLSFEDRLDMGDEAAFLRSGLPRRVLTDLRRGRWVLQAQIDLHGLTRDEARSALAHFLHDSLNQGLRCIRVIHGKGHGSPGKVSILKQLSRGWLAQREEILAFCQAGPHDGGGGALLVLLRAQNANPR